MYKNVFWNVFFVIKKGKIIKYLNKFININNVYDIVSFFKEVKKGIIV